MAFKGWRKESVKLPDGRVVDAFCPVIVSASRSTDIPAFYSKWLLNRLERGYVKWINPFNQVPQYISFANARLIVFWSKNPKPLIQHLPEIDKRGINYYFQYTVNDYELEGLEPNVPALSNRIDVFKRLSDQLGPKRVIWRFDPLMLSESLSCDVLLARIARIADMLKGYTRKLVISFADIEVYQKVRNNLGRLPDSYREFTPNLMQSFSERLAEMNQQWGLEIATCAEGVDLAQYGIKHNRCIDDELMIDLFKDDPVLMDFLGYEPDLFASSSRPYMKDKGQRKECGCIVSKDIGMYNTCNHLCAYCYANASPKAVENNLSKHNPESDSIIS